MWTDSIVKIVPNHSMRRRSSSITGFAATQVMKISLCTVINAARVSCTQSHCGDIWKLFTLRARATFAVLAVMPHLMMMAIVEDMRNESTDHCLHPGAIN